MVEIWIEVIGGIAYIFFYSRTGYHIKATYDARKSVTPPKYHYLSFLGNAFLGIYGFFLGSIVLPLNAIFTFFHSLYHIGMDKGWFENIMVKEDGRHKNCGGILVTKRIPKGTDTLEYTFCKKCEETISVVTK